MTTTRSLKIKSGNFRDKSKFPSEEIKNLTDINISQALKFLKETDQDLEKIIERETEFKIELSTIHSSFQALLEAIVYQQLSGKAAKIIYSRLVNQFGNSNAIRPFDILRAGEDELRLAGLSKNKALAAIDLAEKALETKLPTISELQKMHNSEIIQQLTQIRGIGQWTVKMLLIFKLGRADIMPATDYGLRKGLKIIKNLAKLPTPKELLTKTYPWKPFRTIGAWYLWQVANTKNL